MPHMLSRQIGASMSDTWQDNGDVRIENDGKEKWQSFTASWEDLVAYGADEKEARSNLLSLAQAARDRLNSGIERMITDLCRK